MQQVAHGFVHICSWMKSERREEEMVYLGLREAGDNTDLILFRKCSKLKGVALHLHIQTLGCCKDLRFFLW